MRGMFSGFALAMGIACGSAAANAAAYTYSTTVDLSSPEVSTAYGETVYSYPIPNWPSFLLVAGDTIAGTITFAHQQRLTVSGSDLNYIWFRLVGSNPNDEDSSTVTFHGLQGNLLPNSYGGVSYGNQVFAALRDSLTTSQVSFTGFDYTINVVAGPDTVVPYDIGVFADHASIASDVPEPPAGVLFATALTALPVFRQWRRAVS